MSILTESKKSSDQPSKPKARSRKRILLTKNLWDGWKGDEVQEVEFEGIKFKAVKNPDNAVVYAGDELTMVTSYGNKSWRSSGLGHPPATAFTMNGNHLPTAGSCAYPRLYPIASNDKVAAMYRWWLWNLYLPRGSLAFVTRADAGYPGKGWEERLEYLHETLKRRGMKVTCVNKSIHTGGYPVWLYTHPGDDVLLAERNKKNKKAEAVKDVDILGSADAGVPGLGAAGTPAERDAAAPVVPDAYTLAA
jgi:hypothetical protein